MEQYIPFEFLKQILVDLCESYTRELGAQDKIENIRGFEPRVVTFRYEDLEKEDGFEYRAGVQVHGEYLMLETARFRKDQIHHVDMIGSILLRRLLYNIFSGSMDAAVRIARDVKNHKSLSQSYLNINWDSWFPKEGE